MEETGIVVENDNIVFYKDHIELVLNSKIYPLDVIFSAAYVLTDKSYIIVDGDPKKELIIKIRPKLKLDMKRFSGFEVRDRGIGRPTKRERRLIDDLKKKA